MEHRRNHLIQRRNILGKPCLNTTNRIRIKELYLRPQDLIYHLVVHVSVPEDEDGENYEASKEAEEDEKEDDYRPNSRVLRLLLLLKRLLCPKRYVV